MENFMIYNGGIVNGKDPVHGPADHSYRYGDGLFETMRIADSKILSEKYHFERLFSGMKLLKFAVPGSFTEQKIKEEIITLSRKNNCAVTARVRLSVSRGAGGLYDCDDQFSYLIECAPLKENTTNQNGLIVDIFPDARKGIDAFSNLKSANYLPYVMAALWAKENELDDALVLNQHGRICDATIANIFWVKDLEIYTPPLNEGCVAGVMRRKILESGLPANESILTKEALLQADEVFLTNAVAGARWVRRCGEKLYSNNVAQEIYKQLGQTISS
jgi:branched-chain amino acid aminotransferase